MSRRASQWAYLQDEARLVHYISTTSFTAVGGERQRSYATQQQKYAAGLSKAKPGQSQHQVCQASDFDFIDETGKWLEVPKKSNFPDEVSYLLAIKVHKEKIKPFGDYWESLDPHNFWGGNIHGLYDPGHFERMDKVRKEK